MNGLKIKMKQDWVFDCKNWDEKLVRIVSFVNVEYILCDAISENENEASKSFKLKTDTDSVKIWKYNS